MERYIKKSALVAEIERLRKSFKVISVASPSKDTTLENIAKAALCRQILSFIDTLEVKEVDLEKEINNFGLHYDGIVLDRKELIEFAKHFFELGSLQKEPIGKVWHYQKEEPIDEITDKSRPIVVIYGYNSLNAASKFRCYEDNSEAIWLSNHYEKWAFIEDLINLSQSVKTSDQEEPASEELESWDKFSHIDDAIEDYCRYDSHIVFFTESLNGEPLEEADDREQVESAFKAGAQWQKRKDKQNFKELAVLASHQDGCLALENIQMRLNELIKED